MKHLKSYNESNQSDSLESIIKTIFAEVLDTTRPSGYGVGSQLDIYDNRSATLHLFKPKNRQKSLQDELIEHKKYVELLEELEVGIKRLKDELPNIEVSYQDNAADNNFIYIIFQ